MVQPSLSQSIAEIPFRSTPDNLRNVWDFINRRKSISNRMLCIGTSMTDQLIASDNRSFYLSSLLNWSQARLGNRIQIYEFAGSGLTSDGIFPRLRQGLAYDPFAVWAEIGTNDMAGVAYDTVVARIKAIYDTVLDYGAFLIAVGIPPRDATSSWTAAEWQKAVAVNEWMRAYCLKNRNCFFVDQAKYVIDPASADGYAASGMLSDGTHYTPKGAYSASLAADPVLSFLFPAIDLFPRTNLKVDGTNATYGFVTENPGLLGSDTASGTGASGNEPTSMRTYRGSGSAGTIASAVATNTAKNHREWTGTITPGGVTEAEDFYFTWDTVDITVVAGAWYESVAEFDLSAYDGWRDVYLQLINDPSGINQASYVHKNPFTSLGHRLPAVAMNDNIIKGMPIQAAGTVMRLYLRCVIQGEVTGSPVIKVRKLGLRRIEDAPTFTMFNDD